MKFKDMPYQRPDMDTLLARYAQLAADAEQADAQGLLDVFAAHCELQVDYYTAWQLASIRHTCDTEDEFYNGEQDFFDENSPDYRKAALHALHVCIESGCIIEMNTGGVYRGYRETFYPAPFLLEELARLDGKVTLNADAHDAQGLCFGLSHALEQARKAGIGRIFMPSANGFISKSIKDLPSAEKNGMIQKEA